MTCTWCNKEATEGGTLPPNAEGKKFWLGCETHKNKIEKLGLVTMAPTEIESAVRREAKLAQKANKNEVAPQAG